jgi:transcriptional regulator with XRE-family HTH domain
VSLLDGDAVRAARRDRGPSEAALRARLGVGLGAWRSLLAGRSAPSFNFLVDLTALLDRPCAELLGAG